MTDRTQPDPGPKHSGTSIALAAIGVLGSLASVAALLFIPEFRAWVYPGPLVILLLLVIAGLIGERIFARRKVSSGDQHLLDGILRSLPREALNRIRSEDFSIAWNEDLLYPLAVFENEFSDVEHRFASKPMEKERKHLMTTAHKLSHVEAWGAIQTPKGGRRYLGKSSGELDTAESHVQAEFERKRKELHDAAADFVDQHDKFVEVAKARGFELNELTSDVPVSPWNDETRP